jgi:lipopolysaccharide transport system ATP-binding protein
MKPIIEVKGLSKRYKLGVFNAKTLREEAEAFLARFGRKRHEALGKGQGVVGPRASSLEPSAGQPAADEFWALRDVSFDVQPGEVIGVIGRNGAGKSTLLKILSRITEPTSGEARIRGRVASLLEVGTGFHPELTGRENIYLNGTILGMTKAEVASKFDEIVEFAEIAKFIDTPVKRYSSGMYVRLAFAVAAHLEPEILIVDEVLAVGDAAFQRKCLGKMEEVSGRDGRTVLFVSHQMAMISNLCSRCIFMEQGRTKLIGSTDEVVQAYLSDNSGAAKVALADRKDRSGNGLLRFDSIWIEDEKGGKLSCAATGQTVKICAHYKLSGAEKLKNVLFAIAIYTRSGVCVTELCNAYADEVFPEISGPEGVVECILPRLALNRGHYLLNIIASGGNETFDYIVEAAELDVESGDFFGTGRIASDDRRMVMFDQSWQQKTIL